MTREQIAATKDAIEVLRDALKRVTEHYKVNGSPLWAVTPLWSAANYLWRSLPDGDRE